jgi:hypothetical protein
MGLKAGLDTVARGKILFPVPGIEPRSPGRSLRSTCESIFATGNAPDSYATTKTEHK